MTKPMCGGPAVGRALALLRCAAVLTALTASAAHAAVLTLFPQTQTVEQGSVAAVDVVVKGLAGQRVGAYDFFVNFDDDVLDFLSVDPGPSLGYFADSLFLPPAVETGRVKVVELSFVQDLSALQSGNGDLLLFTLRFSAQAEGVSPLSFTEDILGVAGGFLGDEPGAPIPLSGTDTGSITVVAATPPPPPITIDVPEPSSIALVVVALAAAGTLRRAKPR